MKLNEPLLKMFLSVPSSCVETIGLWQKRGAYERFLTPFHPPKNHLKVNYTIKVSLITVGILHW